MDANALGQVKRFLLENQHLIEIAHTLNQETMRWVEDYPRNGERVAIRAARQEMLERSFKLAERFYTTLAQENDALRKRLEEIAKHGPLPQVICSQPSSSSSLKVEHEPVSPADPRALPDPCTAE